MMTGIPSMTRYNFGEIVLINFPQPGLGKSKKRPALIILDIGDADVVLVPITTKERIGKGDCKIHDWKNSGLLRESWVRLAKIACLPKKDISRKLGKLSYQDKESMVKAWRKLYSFF